MAKTIALVASFSDAMRGSDESVLAAVENGNWDGFDTTVHLQEADALQLLRARSSLDPNDLLAQVVGQLFLWKEGLYRVVCCEFVDGEARVELLPPEQELVAELKRRIEESRHHHLPYYQGFGFIALPEDYQRIQDW